MTQTKAQSYEEPLPALRYVLRDGEMVLQQAWIVKLIEGRTAIFQRQEWRDVPIEAE